MIALYAGKIRILFSENNVSLRIIGENTEVGVEEAMRDIKKIESLLVLNNVKHEAMKRKHGDGKKTDCLVISFEKQK